MREYVLVSIISLLVTFIMAKLIADQVQALLVNVGNQFAAVLGL